jgi:hypothetical protein
MLLGDMAIKVPPSSEGLTVDLSRLDFKAIALKDFG